MVTMDTLSASRVSVTLTAHRTVCVRSAGDSVHVCQTTTAEPVTAAALGTTDSRSAKVRC